jgi:hypothetical protein
MILATSIDRSELHFVLRVSKCGACIIGNEKERALTMAFCTGSLMKPVFRDE